MPAISESFPRQVAQLNSGIKQRDRWRIHIIVSPMVTVTLSVETGTWSALMAKQGFFFQLAQAQHIK